MMSFESKMKRIFMIIELFWVDMIFAFKCILKIFSNYHSIKLSVMTKDNMRNRLPRLDTLF